MRTWPLYDKLQFVEFTRGIHEPPRLQISNRSANKLKFVGHYAPAGANFSETEGSLTSDISPASAPSA